MMEVPFEELFAEPLRNGVSYSSRLRGEGVPMVNMGEAFAYDVIEDQECERVPLGATEKERYLLDEGDLLFVRQSLKYEGAGRCVLVGKGREPRTWDSHLIRVRLNQEVADPRYYYYFFRSPEGRRRVETIIEQVAAAGIRGSDLRRLLVPKPTLSMQRKVSSVLRALDDKIAVNERIAATTRDLAVALFRQVVGAEDVEKSELGELAELVTRGVTPKYTEDESELIVLNQKCIREGRVSLAPARRTLANKVPAGKRLKANDVLVNSTGVGTLGRVARWPGGPEATVDSHVTIVRFDSAKNDVLCAGFAMLAAQPEIERLGEGSTGQTELGRNKLASLSLRLPPREAQAALARQLGELESCGEAALAESQMLAALRDTLLPGLMSGAIRVRDAEAVAEDVT